MPADADPYVVSYIDQILAQVGTFKPEIWPLLHGAVRNLPAN